MSNIIDGKQIAAKIEKETAKQVAALKKKGITPKLAVVLVGQDKPSLTYIRKKEAAAQRVGMDFSIAKIGAVLGPLAGGAIAFYFGILAPFWRRIILLSAPSPDGLAQNIFNLGIEAA